MHAFSNSPSNDPEVDDLDDFAPDSSIRPTVPPSRETPIPEGTRMVSLVIHVSPSLRGHGGSAWVTVTEHEGEVLFEGDVDASGSVELCVAVDEGATHVKAMVEAGTKYRNAIIAIASSGITEHTFA